MNKAQGALKSLINRLGEPSDVVRLSDGSAAFVWEVDLLGTGVAVVRAGSVDGAVAQIRQLESLGKSGLPVRRLMVAIGVNGLRRFHERPDLVAVERAVVAQPRWCEFVAATDFSRISRSSEAVSLSLRFLHQSGVDLALVDAGGHVSRTPSEHLDLLARISESELEQLRRRMLAGRRVRSTRTCCE